MALNGSTSLSFTVFNPNTSIALTGVGFTDALPAGLMVSTPNGLTGSCGGGTITATAGSGSISLTDAILAASTSCAFSVNVTASALGTQNNTTGAVTSVEGGTGGTASASITVAACTYSLSPPDLSNIGPAGGSPLITVTTPSGCPVAATSYQPWVTITGVIPNGNTTTVALQINGNPGGARATSIVVADRLFLITQQSGLGP
jgi:hypothetical protein